MSYEQARDELVAVVGQLEQGGITFEESIGLWERGEALAARCEEWLVGRELAWMPPRKPAKSPNGQNHHHLRA